jgi:hypothetical protein
MKPVDAKVWREKNKVVLDGFYGKLPSVVALIKDLPATSVHVADPEVPMKLFVDDYSSGKEPPFEQQNAVIVRADQLPGMPEYGTNKDKPGSDEKSYISVNWVGYIDWDVLNSLLETGTPASPTSAGAANALARDVGRLRYLIITRVVSYEHGVIEMAAKTFTPGTFKGVAHIVDLNGPKHLGSLAYVATNTSSFESGAGNEKWWLENDLQNETMRAFNTELRKLFPMIVMSELPARDKK